MPLLPTRFLAAALALVALACGRPPASAAEGEDLYQAQTAVTGQGEANRILGFALCLTEVLVKVSGDPRLAGEARVAALGRDASSLVREFRYHDQMSGTPIRDEQGTRDRPYDLIVSFDHAKIDAALRTLGRAPWAAPRPRLAVFLGVRNRAVAFVLVRDGARGQGQREALADAGARRGLAVALPTEAQVAALRLGDADLPRADLSPLDAAAKTMGADLALAGRMEWNEKVLAWDAEWRLARDGVHQWRLRRVTFDELFRDALGGAAQILSGHGEPN
jgi:hypothetical protein